MTIPWWAALLGLALCAPLGAGIAWVGVWLYQKVRGQEKQGWPKAEPFQRLAPDTWQARHRRALDKPRLRPARHTPGGIGNARIHKARMRKGKPGKG